MYSEVKECMGCKNINLIPVIDLGNQYVVDFVPKKNEQLLRAPLTLIKCSNCHLLQLKHRVNPDRLYRKFWYRSGINEQMRDELLAIVQKAQLLVNIDNGDRVLDIGCNDGTLLGWYLPGVLTVGVDPCKELVDEGLKQKKIDIGISDYFSAGLINSVFRNLGTGKAKFKVITSVAMFYDVPDPLQFLKDCKDLLHPEGVLIIQMNYLPTMVNEGAFDFISHEHIALYSLLSLKPLIEKAGLLVQGAQESKSNGGSVRLYITHSDFKNFYPSNYTDRVWLSSKFDRMWLQELREGYDTAVPYQVFNTNISSKMTKLRRFLDTLQSTGKKVYVCGASTRGTALMQYLYKDDCPLLGVSDRDPHKHGLKMVGTWLPIMSEEEVRKDATHQLVLPWHFKESIIQREMEWIKQGGSLVFPLPSPEVVNLLVDSEKISGNELKDIYEAAKHS